MSVGEFVPEIIIGVVLGGFAWAFRNWALTIRSTSSNIIEKLERLARDFAEHRLKTESRMTTLERDVHHVSERLDRCKITRSNDQNS